MCGIVGIASQQPFSERLLEALERLEYRGYDSAGVACCVKPALVRCRAVGKVAQLRERLEEQQIELKRAHVGIAHVRWATHGSVTEANAHPQSNGRIAVVHNGIIENFAELKAAFPTVQFESQTDTEVIVHCIAHELEEGASFFDAVRITLARLRGTHALAIIDRDSPDTLIAARRSSPLIIGAGSGELAGSFFVTSDTVAIAPWIDHQIDLEDNEMCVISRMGEGYACTFFNQLGQEVDKEWRPVQFQHQSAGKGVFNSFTAKEMSEQPQIIEQFVRRFQDHQMDALFSELGIPSCVKFIGCGSSFYAGLVGEYWLEALCNIATSSEIASEFRYRHPVLLPGNLPIVISQSGETIDTIAAMQYVQSAQHKVLAITNVMHSAMAKTADFAFDLQAGPEFGVVSTKAFTAQLAALASFVLHLTHGKDDFDSLAADFARVPSLLRTVLESPVSYIQAAQHLLHARSVLFLGRGLCYPIAMEGALKFKEISYIHAEGYPAGEMKHGPIALIDARVPVVVIAPFDPLFDKTLSNVQEVIARKGKVIFCTDARGAEKVRQQNIPDDQLYICLAPETGIVSKVFVYAVMAQQIAYHAAVLMGRNIDRPRNLAKSVTVE